MSRKRKHDSALMLFFSAVALAVFQGSAQAQPLSEGFENVPGLTASGWAFVNNSFVSSGMLWVQGDTAALGFSAHTGTPNSYAVGSFDSVDPPSQNTTNSAISNYLIAPTRLFSNGDVIRFWTRKVDPPPDFPDRMQVRLSLNGSSTNVGGTVGGDGSGGTGDFSLLLLDINPSQLPSSSGNGYPTTWSQFSLTISGLATPTMGRLAFRYFVVDILNNADNVGLDDVTITPVPEPGSMVLMGLGAMAGWRIRQRRRSRRP